MSHDAGRVVLVGVKAADRIALHAGAYAMRIPAGTRYALHAASSVNAEIVADWEAAMPELPLTVVSGDDVVTSIESAVNDEVTDTHVREVVVVLARREVGIGRTLHRLVQTLRRMDGVAPIVLPPPSAA
jgi:hypothetical protein